MLTSLCVAKNLPRNNSYMCSQVRTDPTGNIMYHLKASPVSVAPNNLNAFIVKVAQCNAKLFQVLLWISSPIVPVTGNLLESFGE